eukprot:scaffold1033_cov408-Prasinococcus_capsulatus_cf.AAC.32
MSFHASVRRAFSYHIHHAMVAQAKNEGVRSPINEVLSISTVDDICSHHIQAKSEIRPMKHGPGSGESRLDDAGTYLAPPGRTGCQCQHLHKSANMGHS